MSDTESMIELAGRLPDTRIEPGLTENELCAVEGRFGLQFPDDLRELLMDGLPVGPRWPEWRMSIASDDAASGEKIRERLDWPLDGMLFDVRHESFWDPAWGDRPEDLADALNVAAAAVRAAPMLIPVYAHRYLPAEPLARGNPVLSVWQTDIIVYGSDLLRYFQAEVGGWESESAQGEREIRCWTRWMDAEWLGGI
jgi:hypothetical protein